MARKKDLTGAINRGADLFFSANDVEAQEEQQAHEAQQPQEAQEPQKALPEPETTWPRKFTKSHERAVPFFVPLVSFRGQTSFSGLALM